MKLSGHFELLEKVTQNQIIQLRLKIESRISSAKKNLIENLANQKNFLKEN